VNLDGEDWGFVGYSGNQVPGNGGFTADLAGAILEPARHFQ